MIELFILLLEDGRMRPIKYYTPDGEIVYYDKNNNTIDFDPLKEYIDYEIKISYLSNEKGENINDGKSDVKVGTLDAISDDYELIITFE